jgi:MFS family permease
MSARTALGATAVTVASVVPVFLVGGLTVQIAGDLGFSPAGLGLAVAVYFGVGALTSVPAGAVVERYGAAVAARVAIGLSVSSMLAIAAGARNLPALLALLAIAAPANGLGQLSSNAWLAGIPRHRQGLLFGIKQAAIPTATLLAGVSVPVVALTLGWRWAFVIAAVAASGALALGPRGDTGRARPRAAVGDQRTAGLVVIGTAAAMGAATAGSMGIFLVDSVADRGLAPGLAGLTLTLGSVTCIAARVGGGALFDRRGAHGDVLVVAFAMAAGAVGLALLAVPGPVALVAGVLLGFGLGWIFPGLISVAVVQLHPQAPAAATSITQTGVYTGASLGPLAFGWVATHAGYPTAWVASSAGMLLAAVLVLLGRQLLLARHRPLAHHPRPVRRPRSPHLRRNRAVPPDR